MNSKLIKIAEKFKTFPKKLASKMRGCARCVPIFMVFGHMRRSWPKKNKSGSKFGAKFVFFFCHNFLECPNLTNLFMRIAHPSILDVKNSDLFVVFNDFIFHGREHLSSGSESPCPQKIAILYRIYPPLLLQYSTMLLLAEEKQKKDHFSWSSSSKFVITGPPSTI